jgi:hypothetical protein
VYRNLLNNGIKTPQIELNMARLLFYVEDYENAKLFIKRLMENKQADTSQRSQAYELLSQILVKEQEMLIGRKMFFAQKEREEHKAAEKTKGRPPKEEPITNRTEPEITKPERKTEHKPAEVQKERVFRIQLGAFSSEERAKGWKEKIEKELGIKELTIVEQLGILRLKSQGHRL